MTEPGTSRPRATLITTTQRLAGLSAAMLAEIVTSVGEEERKTEIAWSVKRRVTIWTTGLRSRSRTRDLSLLHSYQTGSAVHPTSYPMDDRSRVRCASVSSLTCL
jgi:hypothetical protein